MLKLTPARAHLRWHTSNRLKIVLWILDSRLERCDAPPARRPWLICEWLLPKVQSKASIYIYIYIHIYVYMSMSLSLSIYIYIYMYTHIISYHTILYYIMLCYVILYYIIRIVFYHIISYSIILCSCTTQPALVQGIRSISLEQIYVRNIYIYIYIYIYRERDLYIYIYM